MSIHNIAVAEAALGGLSVEGEDGNENTQKEQVGRESQKKVSKTTKNFKDVKVHLFFKKKVVKP